MLESIQRISPQNCDNKLKGIHILQYAVVDEDKESNVSKGNTRKWAEIYREHMEGNYRLLDSQK